MKTTLIGLDIPTTKSRGQALASRSQVLTMTVIFEMLFPIARNYPHC